MVPPISICIYLALIASTRHWDLSCKIQLNQLTSVKPCLDAKFSDMPRLFQDPVHVLQILTKNKTNFLKKKKNPRSTANL